MQRFAILLYVVFSVCISFSGTTQVPFIIGGKDVSPVGKWSFMVSQQVIINGSNIHSCGASLISPDWLITAAHCVFTESTSQIFTILGAHDIRTQEQGDPTRYNISQIIVHPNWTLDDKAGFPNDIALLKLSTSAKMNQYIKPIGMATLSSGNFTGQNCTIIGWGIYDFSNGSPEMPNILQDGNTTVISNSACSQRFGDAIHPFHICVNSSSNSACSGDSGGPLVCQVSGTWALVGLTSWGVGCPTLAPGVFTRVSSYQDWIKNHTHIG